MAATTGESARQGLSGWLGPLTLATLLLCLIGLPLAVWLDLRALSERMLAAQARDTGQVIDIMRAYYSEEVVNRIVHAGTQVTARSDFRTQESAVPIPATLSIELGERISAGDANIKYRFVSDLPFKMRASHELDSFETGALAALRSDPKQPPLEVSGSIFNRSLRIATPIIMGQSCVACHNSHPDSPKTDWKVGDVRGIQQIRITQPIEANIFAFKWLLGYFALSALAAGALMVLQRRQTAYAGAIARELGEANNFLATISHKIAKYISPQIYKSIFSGERDATIATERKKLTIFFSDIKDFTATAERLQPEDLTALLNEYLTAMSAVASAHGGTIDKFIGDAMLVFFGDPETKGVEEDAKACLRMALAMKDRLAELNLEWRKRGIEIPFQSRMGINTGYCNVGNFGSEDRMDYTIIGVEANFAARLQSIADPGDIVLSYETYVQVRDLVSATPMAPITLKGISRKVVPYVVDGILGEVAQRKQVIAEQATGLDLFLDLDAIDDETARRVRRRLKTALSALEKRTPTG